MSLQHSTTLPIKFIICPKELKVIGLRPNNQFLLSRPNFKTLATIGDRAFIAAAPKLWNTLPLTLRNIDNFNLFKNKLKTLLFRQAFNEFKCLD